jgi:hypothetical protein
MIAVFPDVVTTALSLNTAATAATTTTTTTTATTNVKLRVHECSICGAEFASGQALGGHMRRHRPLNAPAERAVTTAIAAAAGSAKKEAGTVNLQELDLNLPAPSDEQQEALSPPPAVVLGLGLGQFIGDGNKAGGGLMLTASALVDCHY